MSGPRFSCPVGFVAMSPGLLSKVGNKLIWADPNIACLVERGCLSNIIERRKAQSRDSFVND